MRQLKKCKSKKRLNNFKNISICCQYLHNPFDVVAPNYITNVYQTAPQGRVLTVDLEITSFSAEAQVRRIPVEYRKCRYPEESNLKYFEVSFYYLIRSS